MITFAKRYPWTLAFVILFFAMSIGFYRVETIQNEVEANRLERLGQNLARDKQFCTAIPNIAEAGAQALVNILVFDLRRDKASPQEIHNLLIRGRRYTDEARRLAILELPECPKIEGG